MTDESGFKDDANVPFEPSKKDKIRRHFQEHKTAYLVAGTAVASAAVATTVTLLVITRVQIHPELLVSAKNSALLQWKPKAEVTVKLIRRGHPGFEVLCNETGERFASIRRAAEVYGLNPGDISRHLRGEVTRVGGKTFTNLGEMAP